MCNMAKSFDHIREKSGIDCDTIKEKLSKNHPTGWEVEFWENHNVYLQLIYDTMIEKQETDISFLENKLAVMHSSKHAIACASGTDALTMALKSYGVEGEEVLVSNFSWFSSATCVALAGGIPVFCDIDINSYHMSIDSIKRMYTDNVTAIVYPHLFGNMSNMDELMEFCEDRDILLIEDACQSIGASYDGQLAGTFGATSTLSFNSNKNVAGISGGGAVLTDDDDVADFCRKYRQHGNGEFLGVNSKMLLLNAKVIDYRLSKMVEWQFYRQLFAEFYDRKLADLPVFVQNTDPLVDHNYHKYVVRFENKKTRDDIRDILNASVHYTKPISCNAMWKDITHRSDDCPNSQLACDTVLTLPLHHSIEHQECGIVIELIQRYFDG